jgi:tungstate transport system substrate-binding protein
MPVLALLAMLVTSLALAPVDAKCADACEARYGTGRRPLTLATGSPGELGLLSALADVFTPREDVTLCWIKAGTGEALELLRNGKADLIMVHAPVAEKKAVADGWAAQRTLIGSNEFFVVGPPDDPAGVAEAKDVVDAFARVTKAKARFFSRGDDSGTHRKEMEIWKKAGLSPSGDWYVVTKTFMLATLKRANNESGYFMTDSSTWVAAGRDRPRLKILFRGDPFIVNTYHALRRPDGRPEAELAGRFIEFLAAPDGQRILRDFGRDRFGEGLYNDAEYARRFVR